MVILPDRCPNKSFLSSKLTPAALSRRPKVCLKSYCAFLHQAHAGIVARDVELEQATIDGIAMSGRCLMLRSLEIKQQLKELLVLAQEEAKTKS